jgi:release factor glutamine methyltransferase
MSALSGTLPPGGGPSGTAGVNDSSGIAAGNRREPLSVASARRRIAARLARAGLPSADIDARLLVGHALALDHASLIAQGERALGREELRRIDLLAARRLAHEPVARIVGKKEFWGLSLSLNPETFVPRPDTETVVSATLRAVAAGPLRTRVLRIADFGTGSGAILLAIVSELGERANAIGTDTSLAALDCASRNAAAHGLRASFIACNYAAAIKGPIDVAVSNPPYIPSEQIAGLEPEVRAFDPRPALDGGRDGLDGFRAIAQEARRILAPDGIVVVELGFGQAAAVDSIFTAAGLVCQSPQYDLCGIPRAVVAHRRA